MELFQLIEDAERWIAALSADFVKAKKLAQDFYRQRDTPSITKILDELSTTGLINEENIRRLENAILQSNANAEELNLQAGRYQEIFSYPEEPDETIIAAFSIKIILSGLHWSIKPKRIEEVEHEGSVFETYSIDKKHRLALIVNIFWQVKSKISGLSGLLELIKKEWTSLPEDELIDLTKVNEKK